MVLADNDEGQILRIANIQASYVDLEIYYGDKALQNEDDFTLISSSALDKKDYYEFDSDYPVFIVAKFMANSLAVEAGFDLAFFRAEKIGGSGVPIKKVDVNEEEF